MQEVFEKIKKRLEKLKEYEANGDCPKDGMCTKKPYECTSCYSSTAIEIVNQVAEEYNQSLTNNNQSLTNDGWIPCSEKLPEEEYDTVLVVTDRNHYCVAVYTKEHGFRTMDIDCEGDFIAWQPLPEPYKPGGE